MKAEDRIAWALENLPGAHIMSSSFGVQSAVMLHMLTRQKPDIPVVLVDTGYLFPETYRFVDELTDRLELNLKVYRSLTSPAWQEARHGNRWEQSSEALTRYNYDNKVEPMERALKELGVGTWFAGIRRVQADTRADKPFVERSGDRYKVHPIVDWNDRDVHRYLTRHNLPYHPLREKGYVSIGDVHSTKSLAEAGSVVETRFGGMLRECGLHEMEFGGPKAQSA